MKKLILAIVAVVVTTLSVDAQVLIESPHPDLDVKITRCSYASGTVVIDMVLTNYGDETSFDSRGSAVQIYDDEGNAYTSSNTKILLGLTSLGLGTSKQIILPQDIPLKFRLQIEGISPKASKFTLVKFPPHYGGSENIMGFDRSKAIMIRNLEWSK
ncbi:MAG: hypothetical protein SNG35_08425 [Rikenellaceae bacterium]